MTAFTRIQFTAVLLAIVAGLYASPSTGNPAWLDTIDTQLQQLLSERYPEDRIVSGLRPLDSRLRLASCESVSVELPTLPTNTFAERFSARISCQSPTRWTVFLPAEAKRYASVAVLGRNLERGQRLGDNDFAFEERALSGIGQPVRSAVEATGKSARRSLPAGTVLMSSMLQQALLIQRGQAVTIVAERPGLRIESAGTALEPGTLGQSIRVRNERSGRVVAGQVTAEGSVAILTAQPGAASKVASVR